VSGGELFDYIAVEGVHVCGGGKGGRGERERGVFVSMCTAESFCIRFLPKVSEKEEREGRERKKGRKVE